MKYMRNASKVVLYSTCQRVPVHVLEYTLKYLQVSINVSSVPVLWNLVD